MLSVNYIADYLNKNQETIDVNKFNKLKVFEKKKDIGPFHEPDYQIIPSFIRDHLNDTFGFLKLNDENHNPIFTFFSSMFTIGKENFYLLDSDEKKSIIKSLIKKMDDEILLKNYYHEFQYTKNRIFSKEKILSVLKDSYQFKSNEYFNLLQQYTSDYLGVHIYIIHSDGEVQIIRSNKCNDENENENENKNEKLLYCFLFYENGVYRPIIKKSNSMNNFVTFDECKKLPILNSKNNNISRDKVNLQKCKIIELHEYAQKHGVSIVKISDKTKKEIKKKKDELIEELTIFFK